jgi:hypothetical protein
MDDPKVHKFQARQINHYTFGEQPAVNWTTQNQKFNNITSKTTEVFIHKRECWLSMKEPVLYKDG